MVLTSFELI
jgi:hypothetical protein